MTRMTQLNSLDNMKTHWTRTSLSEYLQLSFIYRLSKNYLMFSTLCSLFHQPIINTEAEGSHARLSAIFNFSLFQRFPCPKGNYYHQVASLRTIRFSILSYAGSWKTNTKAYQDHSQSLSNIVEHFKDCTLLVQPSRTLALLNSTMGNQQDFVKAQLASKNFPQWIDT